MEAIIQIPLSRKLVSDAIIWLHNKNGTYLVKSRYHIARLVLKEDDGLMESSGLKGNGLLWGKTMEMQCAK